MCNIVNRVAVFLLAAVLTMERLPRVRADELVPPNPAWSWYKGNLHTHSLWSDGNDFPDMIAEWYRVHGYNFLALSDHNILSQGEKWIDANQPANRGAIGALDRYRQRFGDDWVETRRVDGKLQIRLKPLNEFRALVEERGKFILIQGEEITDSTQNLPLHINATNLRDLIKPQGGKDVRETLANNLEAIERQRKRINRPILGHLNHPNFGYAVTAEDMAAVVQEHFFEVFNGHPSVNHRGDELHAGMELLWDVANTIRIAEMKSPPLFGLATDDSHNYFGLRGASPGRGWVMVRAKHLTAEKLIAAIQRGDFYASSGVLLTAIQYDNENKTIALDIAGQEGVTYTTQFIGTPVDYDRSSAAVVDEEGHEVRATRRYSSEVGMVFASVEGTNPRYTLTGNELYVRATVVSSQAVDNPVFVGQRQQAWTQPVGWQQHVSQQDKSVLSK